MLASTACTIINQQVCFAPEWIFDAQDFTNRFEECIKVTVSYPAVQTNRTDAETGYQHKIQTHASFVVMAGGCKDEIELLRCLMQDVIIPILQHEAREMLRMKPTFWAPFHPHKQDGMRRWGSESSDLFFGLV